MAGTLVNLLRKQSYSLQASATSNDTVLTPLIDTLNLTSGVIIVRLYALTLGGATLSIAMRNVMTGPDDPSTVLSGTTDLFTAISITGTPPLLFTSSLTQPVGRYANLIARTAGATAQIAVTMAVDLVIRDS
ncbi:MAG: hypothetical protein ACXVEE_26515 [Polyangiales bacterium]